MNKHKNLNFVQRALDAKNPKALRTPYNESHEMSYYTGADKKFYAIPLIVQEPGKNTLTRFYDKNNNPDWDKAVNHAEKTNERIPLGDDANFAEYFTSTGYKKTFPRQDYLESQQNYSERTNTKPVTTIPTSKNNFKFYKKGGVVKAQEGLDISSTEKNAVANQGQLSQIGKNGIKTKKKLINKKK